MTIDRVLSGAEQWAIIHGDNLAVMRSMPPASVHLAYLDPPFATGKDFLLKDGRLAFSDKWSSFDAYIEHVMARCAAARDLLTEDGALVLHVDPTVSHYLKVALDGLFGRDCFRNELVWRYRRWPTKSRDFQRMHDVLLRYTRTANKERFHVLHEPLAPSTLSTFGKKKQRADFSSGRRKPGTTDEETVGVPMSDVWDIPIVAPNGNERTGWPTQKPAALLDRIVLSMSFPGDVLCEAYCGAGSLCSLAAANGRRCIAIDSSPIAVEIATARLRAEDEARRRATAQLELTLGCAEAGP